MEKLELKLKNMEIFLIKLKDITTEEMIELLEAIGEMKKKIQKFKKGKEVTNVDENVEMCDKDSDDTANDIGHMEEHTEYHKMTNKLTRIK